MNKSHKYSFCMHIISAPFYAEKLLTKIPLYDKIYIRRNFSEVYNEAFIRILKKDKNPALRS